MTKRLVVFDDGWGGELVANFLVRELEIAEVVRVIDWAEAPYSDKSLEEICRLVERRLQPYIGNVDAIILGGYTVSLALDTLRRKYPRQVFVGMGINYDRIKRSRNSLAYVAVLGERIAFDYKLQEELQRMLPNSTFIMPDCAGWQEKIDAGVMTKDLIRMELATDFATKKERVNYVRKRSVVRKPVNRVGVPLIEQYDLGKKCATVAQHTSNQKNQRVQLVKPQPVKVQENVALKAAIGRFTQAAVEVQGRERMATELRLAEYDRWRNSDGCSDVPKVKPNAVLLLNTHFWDIKAEIEDVLGWDVFVMDFREKLLRDVCLALKLRGVDGKRAK